MDQGTESARSGATLHQRATIVLLVVLSCLALAYAVHRAVVLSFTHDESFSFLFYVHRSTMDLLRLVDPYTNNHILNTVGMKWAGRILGTSEWTLRAPNLLLFVVYLYYTVRFLRQRPLLLAMPAFIVLACNTELIGMFSVARGYGLSIGFMWMAMYHYTTSIRDGGRRQLIAFHLASILAIFSSFTQLDFYAATLASYYPIAWFVRTEAAERKRLLRRTWWAHGGMVLLAYWVLSGPVQRMLEGNQLDFGGKTGFWDTTVRTIIYCSTPGFTVTTETLPIFQGAVVSIVLVAVGIILSRIPVARRQAMRDAPELLCFTVVLVAISILSVVQHHVFHADFLEARFALFLMPLFFMVFVQSMLTIGQGRGRWVATPLLMTAAVFAVIGASRKTFPPVVGEWYYDVQTDEAMTAIEEHHGRTDRPVTIGNSWVFEPTINFYRVQRKLHWLQRAHRDGPAPGDDYRYLLLDGLRTEDTTGYRVLGTFDSAGAMLLTRRDAGAGRGS